MIHNGIVAQHEYTVVLVEGDATAVSNAITWCTEKFGPPGRRWFYRPGKFYFRDNKDAFWFEIGT